MFERGDILELTPGASDWLPAWDSQIGKVIIVYSTYENGDTFHGEWLLGEPVGTNSGYGARFFRKIGHIELPPE